MRQLLVDLREFQDVLRDRFHRFGRVLSRGERDQQVEVADGFLAAPQRAGRRHGLDRFAECADVRNELFRFFLRHVDVESPGGSLVHLNRFQNILFALFAEAGQIAQFTFARELFHLLHRAGLEGLPEKRDFFRPERLQIQQMENRFRIFFQQLGCAGNSRRS